MAGGHEDTQAPPSLLSHEQAVRLAGVSGDVDGYAYAYAALHRPGSWEWGEGRALQLRQRLLDMGYTWERDPEAHWRVRWIKEGVDG